MTKTDLTAYIADMAQQLADLARLHMPTVARILDAAAELARDAIQKGR